MEGSQAPQVSRMRWAGALDFKKAQGALCRSMEDEKEGDKVPNTFQRFWRESPEGSINFTALKVSSSANRGSLRSHAPRIYAALPEISWFVWASSGVPYEDRDLRNDRTTPVLPHPPKRSVCSKWQINSDLL